MQCEHCRGENSEQAEICTNCGKSLKDSASGQEKMQDSGRVNLQKAQPEEKKIQQGAQKAWAETQNGQMETGTKKHDGTNFAMAALIIGIVSMLLSCLYMGFLGAVGIGLGIAAIAKKEVKVGKAVVGIVCSVLAIFVSFCMVMVDPAEDSLQTADQAEQATEASTEEQTPEATKIISTPTPTISPEEKSKKIKEALLKGNKEEIKKYSLSEVDSEAGSLLEGLTFEKDEDYTTANTVAETMILVYKNELDTEQYEDIVSNYELYQSLKEEKSAGEYEEIDQRWEEASEAAAQIISNTFSVRYDIEANASGTTLGQIINSITGASREYKHAYYALGYGYDFSLQMWTTDDDQEYIIYTQEAFPKAGKYKLKLIPTGGSMQVSSKGGFEREIATYTMLSESDEAEYSRIEQLKADYDALNDEVNWRKTNIQYACSSITEQQSVDQEKEKNEGNRKNSEKKGQSGYICPESDVRKLTVKEVKKLSKAERRLAKNEIYARYGRKFRDKSLQKYFDKKSWYDGEIEPEDFNESIFNKIEKYNIKVLAKYE